jgi:8-oxo-dGTP pyrophosphatase MutT (NUDIX family)
LSESRTHAFVGVMSDRFKVIAAVYLLFRRGDEILLLLRANTGYEDGKYGLVSGHVDGDEPLAAAAAREAREEAGVEIDPADLALRTVMHRRQDDERVEFFFEPSRWRGEIRNMEPDKCAALSWFPIQNLPENTIPYVREAIARSSQGVPYFEFWKPG